MCSNVFRKPLLRIVQLRIEFVNKKLSLHVITRTETRDENARTLARTEVLRQLQQLERQLSAIESTARTVQGELLASNQVSMYSSIHATCIYCTCTCICTMYMYVAIIPVTMVVWFVGSI